MNQRERFIAGIALAAMITACALTGGSAISAGKAGADAKNDHRQLRHIVMFKFKEGASAKQVKVIEDAFRALPKKIDTITGFEWGTDVSVEDLADGFTHCFCVTFKTQEGLKTYLPHAAHQAFVALLTPHLDKVLVFDYWTRK